jgi:hypothetical protein
LAIAAEIEPGSNHALVGDPTRIRQILFNLLSNAVKFTEGDRSTAVLRPPPTHEQALLQALSEPSYIAFDLLWLSGADLRSLPLSERRRCLHGILPKHSSIITEALSVDGRGRSLFELMRAHDLEGIVAKRLADQYGPRTRWLKIKNPDYSQKEALMNRRK